MHLPNPELTVQDLLRTRQDVMVHFLINPWEYVGTDCLENGKNKVSFDGSFPMYTWEMLIY